MSWSIASEINTFFFGNEWTVLDNRMDRSDILPYDSERNELYRPEKEKSDHCWCQAKLELVPEDELGDQVAESSEQAEKSEDETPEDNKAKWNLGQVRDAEHRHVIQGVKVIFCNAAHAALLMVVES